MDNRSALGRILTDEENNQDVKTPSTSKFNLNELRKVLEVPNDGYESDDTLVDQPVLKKRIWLPTEVFMEIFKYISRRDLLRRVQPVCNRFHTIAERYIPNLHVINKLIRFLDGLSYGQTEAKKHFATLSDSYIDLERYFQFGKIAHFYLRKRSFETDASCRMRRQVQIGIMRQAIKFLFECELYFFLDPLEHHFEYLEMLSDVHATHVTMNAEMKGELPESISDQVLTHPTAMNCNSVLPTESSDAALCLWLHYSPATSETVGWKGQQTRLMNIPYRLNTQRCGNIIEHCKRDFIHASTFADGRSFQVILRCTEPISTFKVENDNTGEMLQLELGPADSLYQIMILRRCLISDLIIARKLFRETFDEMGDYLTSGKSERACLVIS